MALPGKISKFLRKKKVVFEAVAHAETFTSVEEAAALGIEAGEVAKVIVVDTGARRSSRCRRARAWTCTLSAKLSQTTARG